MPLLHVQKLQPFQLSNHNNLLAAAYGMGAYGAADARTMYGAGYAGQAVSAQASAYGVPGGSVPASQYSPYGRSCNITYEDVDVIK